MPDISDLKKSYGEKTVLSIDTLTIQKKRNDCRNRSERQREKYAFENSCRTYKSRQRHGGRFRKSAVYAAGKLCLFDEC